MVSPREVNVRQLAIAALVLASSAVIGAPGRARASDTPTDDGASEDVLTNPEPGTQVPVAGDAYADTDPSAITDFQPVLDPYGTWVDDPSYGMVWTPSADQVGDDFAPYATGGHWAYDDEDTWASDYSWGWVPFHYGRWAFIQGRGWSWIPGRTYAAAWVTWRVGEEGFGYVGWAPVAPTWGWRDGVAAYLGFGTPEPYVFCPSSDVFTPNLGPRIVRGDQAAGIAPRTRPYVKATPTVGRPATPPGPPPSALGIQNVQKANDAGVARARQFARPSTAIVIGARAPVPHVVRPRFVPRQVMVPRGNAPRPTPARRK
jgi:hypothetical protein